MKPANPLQYPLAVLAGGIVLVVGTRFMRSPQFVVIPASIAVATLGATALKALEPEIVELNNPALNRELKQLRQQAIALQQQAEQLKQEATQLLGDSRQALGNGTQLELLGLVQLACDRTQELPQKLEQLAQRMQGKESLLSAQNLEQQLQTAESKASSSQGVAKKQWLTLADRLKRNIALAQEGEDARQAQLASLSTLIVESGGVLQKLQNQLRATDLSNRSMTDELQQLSTELQGFQDNVDVLIPSS